MRDGAEYTRGPACMQMSAQAFTQCGARYTVSAKIKVVRHISINICWQHLLGDFAGIATSTVHSHRFALPRRKAMKRRQEKFSLLLVSGFLLALLSVAASAQVTTADLVGTIKDNSAAVVRGVRVTLTNNATGVSRSVTTDDDGNYIFTSLQPGRYSLTAEAAGFRKLERTGVELQVNQRAQIDLELQVGQVGDTVQIEGTAPLLGSRSSVLGSVIQERQVQDLPLNGRNFVQLAILSPGVSGASYGMRGTIMSGTRPDDLRPGTELFVNGNRESSNNYL